jgi:hypothetical protein
LHQQRWEKIRNLAKHHLNVAQWESTSEEDKSDFMSVSLQKVINTTLRVLLDEINHALRVSSVYNESVIQE